MSDCYQFAEGSRRRQICEGKAGLSLEKTNAYRQQWGLEPLPEVSEPTKPVIHTGSQSVKIKRVQHNSIRCACTPRKPVEGPGTELLSIFKTAGVPSCQQCKELAAKMNAMGADGCRGELESIIDDMLPRAKKWIAEKAPWIKKLLPVLSEAVAEDWHLPTAVVSAVAAVGTVVGVPDVVLRSALQSIVIQSIENSEKPKSTANRRSKSPSVVHRSQRHKSGPVKSRTIAFPESTAPIVRIIPAIRTSARKQPTLQRTIDSLQSGGFETPIVFSEPNASKHQLEYARWNSQLKPFKSFVAMSQRLLSDFPDQWYLLCEDDVVFQQAVADRLRSLSIDTDTVVTLYMSSRQRASAGVDGFAEVSGDVHGSLAYLIHSDALQKIVSSKICETWRHPARVDQFVPTACANQQLKFITHQPSLCQHIGGTSTLNPSRRLDSNRTSDFDPVMSSRPLVTLITPTGDRPEAFALCERWIRQQRYQGLIQWIVVDDGRIPTTVTMSQEYVRRQPSQGHTLCANMREAIPLIRGERILIIEDDEYYGPDYLSTMMGKLQHADLVGERASKYYFIRESRYFQYDQFHHVALCRMGFNRAVLSTLESVIQSTDHRSIDERLWNSWSGSRYVWYDDRGDMRLGVGIKGMPGRPCGVMKAPQHAKNDPDYAQLRLWVGDDADVYLKLMGRQG